MNWFHNVRLVGVIAGALCFAARAQATETNAANDWSFDVSPYLWVANVGVETSLPTASSPGVERFDTRLSAGAMLTAEARYRSVGVFVDAAWVRLNTDGLNPGPGFSQVNLRSDILHTTAALTYRLPLDGKLHADLFAGARVWYVANDLSATSGLLPGFRADRDKTWADPIIGGSVSYNLSPRWSATVKGDIGGFGVAADIAGEVFAGFNYHIADWCSATLGYRYLHEEYDRGNFNFNLDTHGFLLGVGFQF